MFFEKKLITFKTFKKDKILSRNLLIIVILIVIINNHTWQDSLIIKYGGGNMNYETIELKTKRLIIKKGTKEDFLKVYEYEFSKLKNVDGVCKLVKQDKSKIESSFKIGMKKYYLKLQKAHAFDWIIYCDNNPVGNILTGEEDIKTVSLSFNIHPSYWGNGYIKEALSCVMDYLYSLGYDNIICLYQDGNIKAKRALDKLGFKPHKITLDSYKSCEGNLIDEYEVIMTKEDWFSKTGKLTKIKDS